MYDYPLKSSDLLTQLIKSKGISNWNTLTNFVRHIPYGRNTNRTDVSLVITEHKGTCSSKHGLLKTVADLNEIEIDLIMGIYKMNQVNTPKIGQEIARHNLEYIPEAHCYLRHVNSTIDVTSLESNFDRIADTILSETLIAPDQVGDYKVNFHKEYIKNWIVKERIHLTFEEVWSIREQCIKNLSL
ncbi:hypothetical protein M0D21_03960 [Aquimarina sp. D1M17]|uniref:hypothetical protein n=1 Tax=Aquimarina acroporae TaxID=2937283 RepID=UPI0020C10944|nr:hypothetical protein [Aquimarina acroporae]MCK8520707.1 hypothetical protein [Aquimarina acroporae]